MEAFQDFVAGLPALVQWLGVVLVSAIPFIESYFGAVIGVVAGIHPAIAIVAAIIGNVISMVLFVLAAGAARAKSGADEKPTTPRRERIKRFFDRWGVPGVSLLGQTILPSQITSAAMVGFGASRRQVIIWQIVSIVLWGVAFGLLAVGGVVLLGR